MKLSNLPQVQRANKLFYQINNNGYAEVTTYFYAFSTVKETSISLHIPNYNDPNKITIELKISFDKLDAEKKQRNIGQARGLR